MKDDVTLTFIGGDGGEGRVAFGPNRYPTGGSGGKGGDLYLECRRRIDDLEQYISNNKIQAENGVAGGLKDLTGRNGEDLTLFVPPTTEVIDMKNNIVAVLKNEGQRFLLCRGGEGGLGNHHFKVKGKSFSHKSTPAQKGEIKTMRLLYKMRADIALMGLPNAGKSSLLVALTGSKTKIAPYAFTTLSPKRGVTKNQMILVDFPGIIEGFTHGKGFGLKFLHHLENISTYWLCIACDTPEIETTTKSLLQELNELPINLENKSIKLVLTKIDLIGLEPAKKLASKLNKKFSLECKIVSILDDDMLKRLFD